MYVYFWLHVCLYVCICVCLSIDVEVLVVFLQAEGGVSVVSRLVTITDLAGVEAHLLDVGALVTVQPRNLCPGTQNS